MLNRMNNNRGMYQRGEQNNPPPCNSGDKINVQKLIKKLQMLDFSIIDTVLYLDAYPNCQKALDYYNRLTTERHEVAVQLANAGYPQNILSNKGDKWVWTSSPWPWEYEANV